MLIKQTKIIAATCAIVSLKSIMFILCDAIEFLITADIVTFVIE